MLTPDVPAAAARHTTTRVFINSSRRRLAAPPARRRGTKLPRETVARHAAPARHGRLDVSGTHSFLTQMRRKALPRAKRRTFCICKFNCLVKSFSCLSVYLSNCLPVYLSVSTYDSNTNSLSLSLSLSHLLRILPWLIGTKLQV